MTASRARLSFALVSLLLVAVPGALSCVSVYFGHHRRLLAEEKDEYWNYNYNGADWEGTCQEGMLQSPIAIPTQEISGNLNLTLRAELSFGIAKGLHVINTGHALQVEWDELEDSTASVAIVDDSIFGAYRYSSAEDLLDVESYRVPLKPLQFHFHASSEHIIDGEDYPEELHLVTMVDNTTGAPVPPECNEAPCLAVFGVMYKFNPAVYGNGSKVINFILDNAPPGIGAEAASHLGNATLNLTSLLPRNKDYITYSGSLTTPPCTEGVMWHVFLESKNIISAAQRDKLEAFMATTLTPDQCYLEGEDEPVQCQVASGSRVNHRQVLPINNRTIYSSVAPA